MTNKSGTMEAEAGVDMEAVDRLEERVTAAVALIGALRKERDTLRAQVEKSETQVDALRRELKDAKGNNQDVVRLEKERDGLMRDRAAMARKVESILERMEGMGLE